MAVTTREAQIASDGDVGVGRVTETAFDEETGVGVGRVVETVVDQKTGVAAERERVVAAVPDGRGNILLMVKEQVRAVQVVSFVLQFYYHSSCLYNSLKQLEVQVRKQIGMSCLTIKL